MHEATLCKKFVNISSLNISQNQDNCKVDLFFIKSLQLEKFYISIYCCCSVHSNKNFVFGFYYGKTLFYLFLMCYMLLFCKEKKRNFNKIILGQIYFFRVSCSIIVNLCFLLISLFKIKSIFLLRAFVIENVKYFLSLKTRTQTFHENTILNFH